MAVGRQGTGEIKVICGQLAFPFFLFLLINDRDDMLSSQNSPTCAPHIFLRTSLTFRPTLLEKFSNCANFTTLRGELPKSASLLSLLCSPLLSHDIKSECFDQLLQFSLLLECISVLQIGRSQRTGVRR